MSGQFDFREGMLLEKVVYKDNSMDCKSGFLYIGCLLLTWVWVCLWFAFFFYCYVFHERVMFWILIAVWLVFFIVFMYFCVTNLVASKRRKERKARERQENLEQQHKIEEAKRNRIRKAHHQKQENEGHIQLNTEMQNLNM